MLPRPNRLRNRTDFALMRRHGRKAVYRFAIVFMRPNQGENTRFAFAASRKVGGAVQRNRAKRLLREAVRQRLEQFPSGWDFLFVARRETSTASLSDVLLLIEAVLARVGRQLPAEAPSPLPEQSGSQP